MKQVTLLIKPASSLCNMRCEYCFYEDIAKSRQHKNMGIMTRETADKLISGAFDAVSPGDEVSFAFQGGEPTLAGIDFFGFFVNRVRELCPPNINIAFSIQTNGALIDEEWAVFLKENDFLVGISIDGIKESHDACRKDATGKGTWNMLLKRLALLQKHNVRVNVLCVVTGLCARYPERVYNNLKKLGVEYMQFIPCMDPSDAERGKMAYSLSPERYGDFLCRLFDLWYRDWERGDYRSIRLFEDYVNIIIDPRGGSCASCGHCGGHYVVEGDGSVYPCDFYVLDRWKAGNIGDAGLDDIRDSEIYRSFLEWKRETPAGCGGCRWVKLCNGGCKHDRVEKNGADSNYYCAALKKFFSYAEKRLLAIAEAEIASRQRAHIAGMQACSR